MPFISNSHTVPFAAKAIYEALADIETYPQILNYIRTVEILSRNDQTTHARITVGLGHLNFSYICDIHFERYDRITIHALPGLFRHLKATLDFTALTAHKTKIDYTFDSRFKSSLMETTANLLLIPQFRYSFKAFEKFLRQKQR